MQSQKSITELGYRIIGCAIEVHKAIGPGLLESIYQSCFLAELRHQGMNVAEQVAVPIFYRGNKAKDSLKLDLLVENQIILELKAVEVLMPVHKAQLLSYMKLAQKPKGILINFNTENIVKSAIHLINDHFSALPLY